MIHILTTVWGEKHLDLFNKTCLKSIGFDKNLASLIENKAQWNLFTDDANSEKLKAMVAHLPIKTVVKSTKQLRDYIDPVQSATIWQIEECLKIKATLLLAPPDTVFGEESIANMILIGKEPGSVVVVPHPRVLPSFVDDFINGPRVNHQLVDLAWEHLHRSWTEAEIGHPYQSSYVGGVEWQKLGKSTYAITHRLPSPYLINFTEEDLQYFKSAISFGHFDHKWPGDILVPRGRQRYVGSSDAVFICEITEADKNIPYIIPGQPPTGFWRDADKNPHNMQNAQITAIFRGRD